MEIVSISIQEIETLRELALKTFIETYAHKNDPVNFNRYLKENFNKTKILKEIQNEESFFYFVKWEGEIAGYLKLNTGPAQTDFKDEDSVEIERIYLLKSFQGQGIGKVMIGFAKNFTKEKGKEKLWLGVWNENPDAIAFYKKMSFEITGEHTFVVGEERQIDYVMELICDMT